MNNGIKIISTRFHRPIGCTISRLPRLLHNGNTKTLATLSNTTITIRRLRGIRRPMEPTRGERHTRQRFRMIRHHAMLLRRFNMTILQNSATNTPTIMIIYRSNGRYPRRTILKGNATFTFRICQRGRVRQLTIHRLIRLLPSLYFRGFHEIFRSRPPNGQIVCRQRLTSRTSNRGVFLPSPIAGYAVIVLPTSS